MSVQSETTFIYVQDESTLRYVEDETTTGENVESNDDSPSRNVEVEKDETTSRRNVENVDDTPSRKNVEDETTSRKKVEENTTTSIKHVKDETRSRDVEWSVQAPKKKARKSYEKNRKYLKRWEELYPWVTSAWRDGTCLAFCKLCRRYLGLHQQVLKRHEQTSVHKLALSVTRGEEGRVMMEQERKKMTMEEYEGKETMDEQEGKMTMEEYEGKFMMEKEEGKWTIDSERQEAGNNLILNIKQEDNSDEENVQEDWNAHVLVDPKALEPLIHLVEFGDSDLEIKVEEEDFNLTPSPFPLTTEETKAHSTHLRDLYQAATKAWEAKARMYKAQGEYISEKLRLLRSQKTQTLQHSIHLT